MRQTFCDITDLNQLDSVAGELLSLSDNRIFAIYGDLGAGKTTLVKHFCKHLNVLDTVSSPTFSIVNEYENIKQDKIFHFDLYRLGSLEELEAIGISTYLNSGNYCFIEWPQLASIFFPEHYNTIEIKLSKQKRELYLIQN